MNALFELLTEVAKPQRRLAQRMATVDRDTVAEACARHGVSAYLYDALTTDEVKLPQRVSRRMALDADAVISNAARQRAVFLRVLDALKARDLDPIALKGYALAARFFDNRLVRPSTDVDFLVAPSELPRAQQVMESLGFHLVSVPNVADVHEEHHHVSFAKGDELVELHFKLTSAFGRAAAESAPFDRAIPATIDGRRVRVLSAEDELVYLSAHAANHAFLRAMWLVDVQRLLLASPSLNWGKAIAIARELHLSRSVALTLMLVRKRLAVNVPLEVIGALGLSMREQQVFDRVFSPSQLVRASIAQSRVRAFVTRFFLVDSPTHGGRHVLDGARRALRSLQ